MYTLTKNGVSIQAKDDIQLSALLNAGWTQRGKGAVNSVPETPVKEETPVAEENGYTKAGINRMTNEKLAEVCRENGVDPTDMSGGEMKRAIIEKLGL